MNIGEIRKKYGEPDTETVTNIQNIHDPKQTDQIHILSYYGIQIHVIHVNYKEPYDVVFAIDVSSNHHPMKFDIEIGDTKNKIIGLFGKPTESNSSITYSIEEPICCDEVSFYFDEKGDLESVHWKWALD